MKKSTNAVEKMQELISKLTVEEKAILAALTFEEAIDPLKNEIRKCTDTYVCKEGNIALSTWRGFLRSGNFTKRTIVPLFNLFINLKKKPLPHGHRGLTGRNPE